MGKQDQAQDTASSENREARLKRLEKAERSINSAYTTGKAERSKITRAAQLDAAEAVAMAGIAMEADEEADEAMRISVIAQRSGDRERAKRARQREREARKQANADHKAATKSAKQAYDAIKFSAPNKMGFMRAVQVLFAVHIVAVLTGLVFTSRDVVSYDANTMIKWIMIILEGLAFWFFVNRYKMARPFVIGMAAFGILAPAVCGLATGSLYLFSLFLDSLYYIFLILYFALSKRVRGVLVNDMAERQGDYDREDFEINRHGWPFIRNLIMYFIVFSVLGHWMEAAMCQLIRLGLVEGEYDPTNTMLWRDWFYPFPMEGAAVVIIALALYPLLQFLRKKIKNPWLPYAISFVANALTCSIIEFSMGCIINADHQLWDYTDMFCNIMGQVCLQNALAFGVAASIIAWFVYPIMERGIARVPIDIMNIVSIVIFVIGGILWSLYIIDPPETHDESAAAAISQEAQQEAEEIDNVTIDLQLIDIMIDGLEKDAQNAASEGERDLLLRDVEQMRSLLAVAVRDHGLDKLPDLSESGSDTDFDLLSFLAALTAPSQPAA